MKEGDKIQFPFAGDKREGIIVKIFPKTVYIKADFPGHSGKVITRKRSVLEGKTAGREKKKTRAPSSRKSKKAAAAK